MGSPTLYLAERTMYRSRGQQQMYATPPGFFAAHESEALSGFTGRRRARYPSGDPQGNREGRQEEHSREVATELRSQGKSSERRSGRSTMDSSVSGTESTYL